jgi:hypothetical protein
MPTLPAEALAAGEVNAVASGADAIRIGLNCVAAFGRWGAAARVKPLAYGYEQVSGLIAEGFAIGSRAGPTRRRRVGKIIL